MLDADQEEGPAQLFGVPQGVLQDVLVVREVGLLGASGAQVEVPQGALAAHEAGLLGVFVGPEVTELWVFADPVVGG